MKYALPFALLLCACDAAVDDATESQAIRQVLAYQQAAWNTGDIPGFMEGYVPDETLRFASGGSVNRGWQVTLDRYLARYTDRAAMGELTFSDLEVDILDADDALVFGRWRLQRESDAPGGLFTLHMVKRDGEWRVQSDHTSSEAN